MDGFPKGIANLGNTCYLNSLIQLLSNIHDMNNIIYQTNTSSFIEKLEYSVWDNWNQLLIILNTNSNKKELLYPSGFLKSVQTIAKNNKRSFFQKNSQEDITEFFLFFINTLHECVKTQVEIQITGTSQNTTDNIAIEVYKYQKDLYEKEGYSNIQNLFEGIMISSINTNTYHNYTPEPFYYLNIPITSNVPKHLVQYLEEFTSVELLTQDNKWFNDKNNTYEDAQKKIFFWKFPQILVICFQRSLYNNIKNNTIVNFSHELDLRSMVHCYKKTDMIYDLVGVCNHHGDPNNGHYTSFVLKNENWFFCSDEIVQIVEDKNHIISQNAYCLFYVKKNKTV